jgi:hypothetical protein
MRSIAALMVAGGALAMSAAAAQAGDHATVGRSRVVTARFIIGRLAGDEPSVWAAFVLVTAAPAA